MAKTKSSSKNNQSATDNIAGRTLYYDELHFIPTKQKDEYWAAQVLYFNKMVCVPFIDRVKVRFYRDLEKGKINEKLYREFIDPKMPDGSGGDATYFKSNWQTCPIYMHLENIKEAQLKKLPLNIVAKAADEFSKLKQQKDNDKIIGANYMRNFLNEINPVLGIRQLKADEDPFAFIDQMQAASDKQQQAPQQPGQQAPAANTANPTTVLDALKAKIANNDMLSIWNEYLYKDGVEVAIEIGIDTYINAINKFRQSIMPRIISDIKNFNAHLMRHYTSETTGRPIIEYQNPEDDIRISNCKLEDLSDNTATIKEYDVTFGQFVQMAGGALSPEQLKMVFLKNREFHGVDNTMAYEVLTTYQRNSAKIRIGYHEFETQNMDVYADYINAQGNRMFKLQDDHNYQPTDYAKKTYQASRVEKHYNVWYSFYYLPLDSPFTLTGTTSFKEQAQYIFKFGPIQDQVREGDDFRYAKGTFMGFKRNRFSFSQIEHSYMPEIIKLWHLFQNDLSSSQSDGVVWAEEVINNMIQYVDSAKHKDPKSKKMEAIRIMRQTNSAIATMTKVDGEGNGSGEIIPFKKVELNSLDTAAKRLALIMNLYELLTKSLGFNEIAEGQSPQPRQNFGGINLAMVASSNATYDMEEAMIVSYLTLGERLMYYIKQVVDEGDTPRAQEFYGIVGDANAMAAKSIKDIPLHKMNLHLENLATDEQKKAIMDTAAKMAATGVISPDQVLFLSMIDNVKYAYAILAIEIRAGQLALQQSTDNARLQTRQDLLFQTQMKIMEVRAGKAGDLEIKQMMAENEKQITIIDNQLKLHGQVVTKNLINDHRIQQSIIDNKLSMNALIAEQSIESHNNRTI